MNVQNAVWTAGERHALFPRGTTLVLGVSGGADSLALLHALAALRRRLGLTLIAATLDHGLRGRDGAADAAHVAALGEAWRVPVVVGTANVAALAVQQRAGIEEAARNARYAFLAEVARSHGAGRIAVGHHADDQAETVLMHLLRGAGLDGLGGMRPLAPVPGAPDLLLVRPLLGVTRAQIAAYCARHAITARDDATNADTVPTRGWLRHELLPLMHSRFPGAARALSDLADSAALDESLLEAMLTQTLLAQASVTENAVRLPRALFRDAHLALQRRFVRWAAARLAPGAELSHERTDAAVQFLRTGAKGQMIELAGGIGVRVLGEEILMALRAEPD